MSAESITAAQTEYRLDSLEAEHKTLHHALHGALARAQRDIKALQRDVAVLQGRVAAHSEIIALAGLHTVAPPRGDVDPSTVEG